MEKNNDKFCQPLEWSVTLGFRRVVDEKRAFLGYYAANSPEQRSSLEQELLSRCQVIYCTDLRTHFPF